ncbi:MAG: hypothetical protein HZC55_14190 [Verrucomicrobia bacterium]|nr:hypothetical protein [Verrucomicrobiota bacterium]
MIRHLPSQLLSLVLLAAPLSADPLSRKTEIDFYRDVPSRNLKGLATRSDGRLVAGPTLVELAGTPPAELLWCLEPGGDPGRFLVGTGPEGRIFEVTVDPAAASFQSREIARLEDPQVFALRRLPDGSVLAGTSPKGALCLLRDGKVVARTALPVDSIFDLISLDSDTILVGTGNPGRIYRLDLGRFRDSGVHPAKVTDAAVLAERGLTVFGQIRDRNVRRLAVLADGRVAAGSSPRGNVYLFPREAGGAPVILQENRDGEVTDLLPLLDGDLLATIVFAPSTGETRITPSPLAPRPGPDAKDPLPPPSQPERFGGRSTLVRFPARGFPETLTTRTNTAFYRVARRGDLLILAGGEQGELAGYDLKARLSLWFAGSASSQLNHLLPLGGSGVIPDRFVVLRNNAPGFALLDFAGTGRREAETRRLDLPAPSLLGAVRFNRLRSVPASALTLEVRTSNGTDEVEGWTPWTPFALSPDQGWRGESLRGRALKLRVAFEAPAGFEIDRASLFFLPQNRRPQLQEFRVLAPGLGLLPASDPTPSASLSLNQLLQGSKDEDRRRSNFLTSQIVPSPGVQVVLWNLLDPDGDALASTFSLRREGEENWTDVVTATRDSYAQFNTRHLPDGIYFTRLVATEVAPRPAAERLSHTFETDDLVIDHTAPELLEATARRTADSVVVTVRGRDQLSLLDSLEVVFNNNVRENVEHPIDGVRDGREETFVLEVPVARVANATSLELTLFDQAGNSVARRLTW